MRITNLASAGYALFHYLKKNGYDAKLIYAKANLNCDLMSNPGYRFPNENLKRLWQDVSGIVSDPCFGLELSKFWHPSNLGFLGYAMFASHSLRTALERLERYHRVISDFKFIRMDESNEGLNIVLLQSREFGTIPAQIDALFALIMDICRRNYTQLAELHDQRIIEYLDTRRAPKNRSTPGDKIPRGRSIEGEVK